MRPALFLLILAIACGGEHPAPPAAPAQAAPAPQAAIREEAAEPPPPPTADEPGAAEARADVEALAACSETDHALSRCEASKRFCCGLTGTMQAGTEAVLVDRLRRSKKDRVRMYILMRLASQPGPRNSDPERARALLAAVRAVVDTDRVEASWVGRVVGAIALEGGVREEIAQMIADHPVPLIAGGIVEGLGIGHPHDRDVLDLVDRQAADPRAEVRAGVVEAYGEARDPDLERACGAWSRATADSQRSTASRAAALISVTPRCKRYQAKVLADAEKRLRADPHDGSIGVLEGLCSNRALRRRVTALAISLVPRLTQGEHYDAMRAIAACDPRGPDAAMQRWIRKGGAVGHAAERAAKDVDRQP